MSENRTIRLRTTPGESQNIQVKIEQEFDTLDILSLKITQEDAYRNFCSDYGVIVGRVIANDGFGVENAKISVFIPLSNEDENDPVISTIYPYTTPNDTDSAGVRYNLLPKEGKIKKEYLSLPQGINPNDTAAYVNCSSLGPSLNSWSLLNGNNTNEYGELTWVRDINTGYGPDTPVGTFPSKTEVLNNDTVLEVYDKYYKFTTRTNTSGDYMIFGVPTGNQTVHMDVDLSDAGGTSLTVDDFINAGIPSTFFTEDGGFKSSTNLDSLPQIESRNIGVEVVPFWGNPDQCEIGITRLDFNLNKTISPSAILILSTFTNNSGGINKNDCDADGVQLSSDFQEIGNMKYMPVNVKMDAVNGNFEKTEFFDDGIVFISIPMYENRIITDEFGNFIPSPDNTKGIPTSGEFKFYFWGENQINDSLLQDGQGGENSFGTASHISGNLTFNYDIVNKQRRIYTLGASNFAQPNSDLKNLAIRGLANGQNVTYPTSFVDNGSEKFGMKLNTSNGSSVCYGSLYFVSVEWKGCCTYCGAVVGKAGNTGTNPWNGLKYNSMNITSQMDITEVIKLFYVFGGGISAPTSGSLNIFQGTTTPSSPDIDLSNQTIPLRNLSNNLNDVLYPLNLDTDQKYNNQWITVLPYRATLTANQDPSIPINPDGSLINKSIAGRYHFYFGLKSDVNALTKLKEKLGV